jgi:hypothetical protein
MLSATFFANPIANIQPRAALGAGPSFAARASLGRESIVGHPNNAAGVIAFELKHCAERRPAGIQNRFRYFGFCQAGSIHISNENCTVVFNKLRAQLVQKVFTTICNFCVDRFDSILFIGSLRHGQGRLQVSIEALSGCDLTVRSAGKILQAKIDANRGFACGWRWLLTSTVTFKYHRPRLSSAKLPARSW